MKNKQGNPAAVRLLGVMRGAPENAPRALIRHEGGILMVDPRESVELGLRPKELYKAAYGHGHCVASAEAEEILERVKGRARILDSLPFTIIEASTDGLIVASSGAIVPGLTDDEIIGANVCDLLESRHHRRVLGRYEESVRSGRWFHEYETLEGDEGWYSFNAWCARSMSGSVLVFTEKNVTRVDHPPG